MKHKVVLVAVATLFSGTLTACGGGAGDSAAYCDSLKKAKEDFSTLESGNFDNLDKAIDQLHKLADEAPDDVKSDWETVDGALTDLQNAFEEAGLKLSDLEGLSNGEIPEGADMEKLTTLTQDLGSITSDKVQKAGDNIEKHAKDECDVDLSGS